MKKKSTLLHEVVVPAGKFPDLTNKNKRVFLVQTIKTMLEKCLEKGHAVRTVNVETVREKMREDCKNIPDMELGDPDIVRITVVVYRGDEKQLEERFLLTDTGKDPALRKLYAKIEKKQSQIAAEYFTGETLPFGPELEIRLPWNRHDMCPALHAMLDQRGYELSSDSVSVRYTMRVRTPSAFGRAERTAASALNPKIRGCGHRIQISKKEK